MALAKCSLLTANLDLPAISHKETVFAEGWTLRGRPLCIRKLVQSILYI
ncbi:hypothetical protein KL86SPO_31023 [uncultured Sporomusa sp.]|uniref:Uncharacterized protein n=1 Tax=uncultured Sporomusa sp. TaxID=307249 RepID=A0A212LTB0_9FIRM|nr:hypothetical protein KL86SPO_31023 [uncultured Sporomusa sp.]